MSHATPIPSLPRRILRAWHPARLAANLRNPIFQKEVYVSGRKRGTYILRCSYLLILLGLVVITYLPMVLERHTSRGGIDALQRLQFLAPQVTLVIAWFQYVALVLIAPALTGGMLCDERRSGSLGTLLTTPLTAFQIAFGKLSAVIVQIAILVLLAMPMLLALRVFGGVPIQAVWTFLAIALSTALLGATLALYFSARATKGFAATSKAILTTFAFNAGPTIVIYLLALRHIVGQDVMLGSLALCSPAVMGFTSAELAGGVPFPVEKLTFYNILYNCSLALIAFLALVVRLRRTMLADAGSQVALAASRKRKKQTPQPAAQATPDAMTIAVTNGALDGATDAPTVEHDPRAVGDRPVHWRECRQPAFKTRLQFIIALVIVSGLLIFINYFQDDADDRHEMNQVVVGFGIVIFLLLSTGASTGAVTSERESRTLDVLLTTPLSAREIVYGKFWGALRRQWFLPTLLLAHLILSGVFSSTVPFVAPFFVAAMLACGAAFLSATGVWMSVRCKRTTPASICNALIALGVWLLPFPILGMSAAFLQQISGSYDDFAERAMGCVAAINPVFLAITSVSEWHSYSDHSPYHLPPPFNRLNTGEFTALIAFVCGVYYALTKLALWRASTLLARAYSRAK